jgi:hypothetical protein
LSDPATKIVEEKAKIKAEKKEDALNKFKAMMQKKKDKDNDVDNTQENEQTKTEDGKLSEDKNGEDPFVSKPRCMSTRVNKRDVNLRPTKTEVHLNVHNFMYK